MIGHIDSLGYSVVFMARVLKSKDLDKAEISLNGVDLIGGSKTDWIHVTNPYLKDRLIIQVNENASKTSSSEDDSALSLSKNALTSEGTLSSRTIHGDEKSITNSRGLRVFFRDEVFEGLMESKYYHISLLISLKVMNQEEQMYVLFTGEDLEAGGTKTWINQSFALGDKFELTFK